MTEQPTGYRAARGCSPVLPGTPLPEDRIRALRDAEPDLCPTCGALVRIVGETTLSYDRLAAAERVVAAARTTCDVEWQMVDPEHRRLPAGLRSAIRVQRDTLAAYDGSDEALLESVTRVRDVPGRGVPMTDAERIAAIRERLRLLDRLAAAMLIVEAAIRWAESGDDIQAEDALLDAVADWRRDR